MPQPQRTFAAWPPQAALSTLVRPLGSHRVLGQLPAIFVERSQVLFLITHETQSTLRAGRVGRQAALAAGPRQDPAKLPGQRALHSALVPRSASALRRGNAAD